jgi:MFS family permease
MLIEHDKSKPEPALGWLMVVMAAVGMVATLPGRTHGLGMITERLLADSRLGIDRIEFGRMNLWATLLGALFCLACGQLVDRFGSRRVMTAVVLLLGLTVLGMCRVTDRFTFFGLLIFTRGLGQSALSIVALTLVGKWFHRRLPVAMGLFSVLVAIGFMSAFAVCRSLHSWDWTRLWASLGWILVLFVTPAAWLFVRDGYSVASPEPSSADTTVEATCDRDWSLADALTTPAFWTFGLATSIYGLIAAGTSLFNESLLAENHFPPTAFYEVAIVGSFVGMAFNFLGGMLCRRGWIKSLTAAALVVLGLSLAFLPSVSTRLQLLAYAIGMGASGGVVTVVFFTVWGQLYGQTNLGRIQGIAQMLTVFASALGPELMAQWKQRTGSYSGLLYLLAAVVAGLCACVALTPLPRPASTASGALLHPQTQSAGD